MVDWNLGVPRVDVGQQFQAGMDAGTQRRQQQERTSALRGYAANPNGQGAQRALLVADPELAAQLGGQRRQDQQFQHQQAMDALEQHRERIIMGGRIFASVRPTDEASYQQARQMARQAGVDLTDVPQHFDPQYVQGVVSLSQHLSARAAGPTVLNEGATLVDPATGQTIASGSPARPRYYSVPPGGTLQMDPSYPGGAPPANLPHASTPADIAHLAPGSQFIAPDGTIHIVPGGAPQPQAASTFPGVR